MRHAPVLLVLAALSIAACAQPIYSGIDIEQTHGDHDAQIDAEGLLLTHGHVMVFEAHLRSSSDVQFDALSPVWLRAVDEPIARVRATVYNHTWALVGTGVGRTELEILVDDEVQDTLVVTIVEPQ